MKILNYTFTFLVILTTFLFAQTGLQTDLKESFSSASITPSISVTIGGNFIVNGTFSAYPNERVDQFVTRMFDIGKAQMIKMVKPQDPKYEEKLTEVLEEIEKYPMRDITLKRANGEVLKIDLEKFRVTGDFNFNPYLKNDDVLIFPKYREDIDFFRIDGAVNNPGRFQFMEGDRIKDAVDLALGLSQAYEKIDRVEIYRLSYNGKLDTIISLPLDLDFPLKRGDRIRIVGEEPNRKDYFAYVSGEVKQPGTVALPKMGLPLREVIKQTGGLTEFADLSRAEIIRGTNAFESVFFSEEFEELMMRRMANIKEEDSLNFLIDNKLRFSRGVLAYDLSKFGLKTETASSDTILIQNGDFIFIPQKIDLVYVFGQVNNFGYVKYEPGKDYRYYIEMAGGLGVTAKKEVYVIKSKSRAWILATKNPVEIEPGDFIWVPKKPIRDFDYYIQRVGFIGSIVTGIMTTLILLFKK